MKRHTEPQADRGILADSGMSETVAEDLFMPCDTIGPRFAGTDGYRRAAEFMLSRFRAYRLDRPRSEPFSFTAWRRGTPATLTVRTPLLAGKIAGGTRGQPTRRFIHTAADMPEMISLDLREAAAFAARILLRAASDERWPRMRRRAAEVGAWREEKQ